MRFRRRPSRRPLWIALGAAALTALVWTLVANGRPQVTAVFPDAETFPVPAPAPLQVNFDRPMDPDSVEAALSAEPARGGTFTWEENTLTFTPDSAWPSGAEIRLTLSREASSAAGLRMAEPYTWTFRTAPTLLAYLWPAGDPETTLSDLYVLDPIDGAVDRLTETDYGVLDYSLSPDGLSVLMSVANRLGGADIAELDLLTRAITVLLPCGADLCSLPQYAPSGESIVFENVTSMEIFLLAPDGELEPLGSGRFPAWSSEGMLLGYTPGEEAYFVLDPVSGQRLLFENNIGEPAAWSPRGDFFMAPVIAALGGESFASHLALYTPGSDRVQDLTTMPLADDNVPTISPDGDLVAFARRSLAPESWTPGRQLWVMGTDGADARALTTEGLYNHTALAWHPDGDQVAYVRSNQADLNEAPEIWVISVASGETVRLVIGGFAPVWVP